ncbi:MAG TPA: cupredoxin domain-containing protein [Motilibacteraceae bacterium]|nr:cupredoxin domain-containing protein [Motilibacteraceae bacterium]
MSRLGTTGAVGFRGTLAVLLAAGMLTAGCSAGSSGTSGSSGASGAPTTSAGSSMGASASSGGSAGVTASASASAGSSDGTSVTAIAVSIAGGKVSPAPDRIQVKAGSTVKLTVTSDVADEVHVHGIDKEFELSPGQPGSITFTVTDPGVYEVETHESGKTLFQLVVR